MAGWQAEDTDGHLVTTTNYHFTFYHGGRSVFYKNDGALGSIYVVLYEGNIVTSTYSIRVFKSTDLGATFSEMDSGNRPVSVANNALYGGDARLSSGGYLHIVYGSVGLAPNDWYRIIYTKFDTSTDTWSQSYENVFNGTYTSDYILVGSVLATPKIVLDSDGLPHVFFTKKLNSVGNIYYSYREATPIWSSEALVNGNNTSHHYVEGAAIGSDDRISLVYVRAGSPYKLVHRSCLSGSWDTETDICTAVYTGSVTTSWPASISIDGSGNRKLVHYSYYYVAGSGANPSWLLSDETRQWFGVGSFDEGVDAYLSGYNGLDTAVDIFENNHTSPDYSIEIGDLASTTSLPIIEDTPRNTHALVLCMVYNVVTPIDVYLFILWWSFSSSIVAEITFDCSSVLLGETTTTCPMITDTSITPYCPVEIWDDYKGRADSTVSDKLACSIASFSTWGVAAGMAVYNRSQGTSTTVTAVDSETALSIADDIFTSGDFFTIEAFSTSLNPVLRIYDWREFCFSSQAKVQVNNADSYYDSTNLLNKWLRIRRGYVDDGDYFTFEDAPYMRVIDHGWASQPQYPQDAYDIVAKGPWEVLANYKLPDDFYFNQSGDGMNPDYSEIESMTAYEMVEFVLLLAGFSLGSDIEDVSSDLVYTSSPELTFYAGTSGAFILITILSMYSANILFRKDVAYFLVNDNGKSYTYKCPTAAGFQTMWSGSRREGLPTILKAIVQSSDEVYSGEYESTDPQWTPDMYTLVWTDETGIVTSNEIAATIAQSIVERSVSGIDSGSIFLPIMDVCQECFTESVAVDSRANTSQTGHTAGLIPNYDGEKATYSMTILIGGVGDIAGDALNSYINEMALGLGGGIPSNSIIGSAKFVTSDQEITDNRLIKGDTIGKRGVQETGITCDDSQNLSGIRTIAQSNYHDMAAINLPSTPSGSYARLFNKYDATGKYTMSIVNSDGTTYPLESVVSVVRNTSGVTITKGMPVYVTDSTGVYPEIAAVKADSESTMPACGVAMVEMANNAYGRVMRQGCLTGLSNLPTASFSDGDPVYASEATAGAIRNTPPAGYVIQQIGICIKANDGVAGIMGVELHTPIIDEDAMTSDTDALAPSQQSTKAYVDTHAADTSTHGVADLSILDDNDLLMTILKRKRYQVWNNAGYYAATSGSGGTSQEPFRLLCYTGTTASSAARLSARPANWIASHGNFYLRPDFSKEMLMMFVIARSSSDSEVSAYAHLMDTPANGAADAYGFGIKFDNLDMYGESYGSAGVALTSKLMTVTIERSYCVLIHHQPSIPQIDWYVDTDGSGFPSSPTQSQTTSNNIPQAQPGTTPYFVISIGNGVTGGTNCYIVLSSVYTWINAH